jgi:hypothetical protein
MNSGTDLKLSGMHKNATEKRWLLLLFIIIYNSVTFCKEHRNFSKYFYIRSFLVESRSKGSQTRPQQHEQGFVSMQQRTNAHFNRFLTVLEYSPIERNYLPKDDRKK